MQLACIARTLPVQPNGNVPVDSIGLSVRFIADSLMNQPSPQTLWSVAEAAKERGADNLMRFALHLVCQASKNYWNRTSRMRTGKLTNEKLARLFLFILRPETISSHA